MDIAMLVMSAGVTLWTDIRESVDPDIRREWDLLFLADVIELRKRLHMPMPAGLDLSILTVPKKKEG